MKNLLFVTAVLISATSCGSNSSPEKRMNIKNHELKQKVAIIFKQQQILRDSIYMMNKEIEAIHHK